MTYHWIDQAPRLAELAGTLPAGAPLFLDTEFMRERTFWPQLALVQVNAGDAGVWLIDPPALADAAPLAGLLAGRPLVMHACSEDIEALRVFTGVVPASIQDTQIAAAFAGHDLQCSYQRLVRELTGTELPKDATRTDWLQRPLSPQQLAYARDDVVWLPELLSRLQARLDALGRTAWWQEECQRQLEASLTETTPDTAWRQVKGAGNLAGRALARLVVLARWRDSTARERDLPRGFLVRDPALLALAQEAPQRRDALAGLDVHPSVVRRDGDTLLALLREGEQREPPAPLPGPPTPEERALIKALRARVAAIAESLGMSTDVLMRRRWLEALVRDPAHPPAPLQGWRQDVITRPLLEMLP